MSSPDAPSVSPSAPFETLLAAVRAGRAALDAHPADLASIVPNQMAAAGLGWSEIETIIDNAPGRPLLRLERSVDVAIGPVALARGVEATACAVREDVIVASNTEGGLLIWSDADRSGPVPQRGLEGARQGAVSLLTSVGPDNRLLSGGADGVVHVWPSNPDASPRTFSGHTSPITHAAYSGPDRLVAAARDGSIRVWNRESGEAICALIGHTGPITSIDASTDHATLVSGSTDGTLRVWDVMSGRVRAVLRGHRGEVTACAFVNRASYVNTLQILSASIDGLLKLWSLDGDEVVTFGGHAGTVWDVAVFEATGAGVQRAVSSGEDGTVRVWDLRDGRELHVLRGHRGAVTRVLILGRSPVRTLSASRDGTCRLWNIDAGLALQEYRIGAGPIAHMSTAEGAGVAACVVDDGTLVRLDLEEPESSDRGRVHVAINGTGNEILAGAGPRVQLLRPGSDQRMVKAERLDVGDTLGVARGAAGFYASLHRGKPEPSSFASGGMRSTFEVRGNCVVQYWPLSGVREEEPLTVTSDAICIALSPSGSLLLTGGRDGAMRAYRRRAGTPAGLILDKSCQGTSAVHACACDRSELRAATACEDGTLGLWDLKTGIPIGLVHAHDSAVLDCDISHDGAFAISASADGTLKVWDASTGEYRRTLEGHDGPVTACWIAGNADRAVSCSRDGSVKLWSLTEGRCLDTFYGEAPFVTLSLATGEPIIAVGDETGRVRILRHTDVAAAP